MYRHLFFLIFFLNLTLGAKIDLQKLYKDAEAQMDEKVKLQMMAGSTSSRFNRKKFTE